MFASETRERGEQRDLKKEGGSLGAYSGCAWVLLSSLKGTVLMVVGIPGFTFLAKFGQNLGSPPVQCYIYTPHLDFEMFSTL